MVFAGTWCGHSTRCLSAGAGVRGIPGRVHGCDFFVAGGGDYVKLKWTTYHSPSNKATTDILPIFKDLTTPFYPSIKYHRGDCHKLSVGSWGGGDQQLSVFTTDASKSDDVFVADFKRVWSRLGRGTILMLADFVAKISTNPDVRACCGARPSDGRVVAQSFDRCGPFACSLCTPGS